MTEKTPKKWTRTEIILLLAVALLGIGAMIMTEKTQSDYAQYNKALGTTAKIACNTPEYAIKWGEMTIYCLEKNQTDSNYTLIKTIDLNTGITTPNPKPQTTPQPKKATKPPTAANKPTSNL